MTNAPVYTMEEVVHVMLAWWGSAHQYSRGKALSPTELEQYGAGVIAAFQLGLTIATYCPEPAHALLDALQRSMAAMMAEDLAACVSRDRDEALSFIRMADHLTTLRGDAP